VYPDVLFVLQRQSNNGTDPQADVGKFNSKKEIKQSCAQEGMKLVSSGESVYFVFALTGIENAYIRRRLGQLNAILEGAVAAGSQCTVFQDLQYICGTRYHLRSRTIVQSSMPRFIPSIWSNSLDLS